TLQVIVLGIGAGGWEELPEEQRTVIRQSGVVLGGRRLLAQLPDVPGQRREPWPSPLRNGLAALLASLEGRVVALASGDPLLSGVAATLLDLLPREHVQIHPAVSSVALARAEM